jgi:two-component system, chemotaxis family, sensor histidine kinase and response regulator WspE
MFDLFRVEAENQAQVLTAGLLELERNPTAAGHLEACMRAAHSLKGAARIIGLNVGVGVAHTMEDCFVAAQKGRITLRQESTDLLLRGVDLLTRIAKTLEADISQWEGEKKTEVEAFLAALTHFLEGNEEIEDSADKVGPAPTPAALPPTPITEPQAIAVASAGRETTDRVLRVTAENLNRLLGLAGESLVESRWLKPFAESLLRLKRQHNDLRKTLGGLRETLSVQALGEQTQAALADAQHRALECQQFLSQRLVELEMFDRRSTNLSHRLYDEALACRMRPFTDGVQAFPRMVRGLARSLGKQAKLEIIGEATEVDRDILEKLDAPLGHLLRNAVDHGIESADERRAAGKPAEGVVRFEARHSAGVLQIIVSDDGCGIDVDRLRKTVVERNLTNEETAAKLTDAELLEFLFLPGFTMKDTVTEISGRGVGLDVVQNMVKQVRGTVRVTSQLGKGTHFQLQLPLTLSVIRTLLAEIGGEPYAFPLVHIVRTLKLPKEKIELLEGRQHFDLDSRRVGLVTAHQVLYQVAIHGVKKI